MRIIDKWGGFHAQLSRSAIPEETEMLAIAGAVLINAACILIASGGDTTEDVYALTRILITVGTGLMCMDFTVRLHEFAKRSKAEHIPSTHKPAEPGAATDDGSL